MSIVVCRSEPILQATQAIHDGLAMANAREGGGRHKCLSVHAYIVPLVCCSALQCVAVCCSVCQCEGFGTNVALFARTYRQYKTRCAMSTLCVSFAEYGLFNRALLQKRPIIFAIQDALAATDMSILV